MSGALALTVRMLRQDSRLLRFHLLRLAIAALLALGVYVMLMSGHSESPGRDLLDMVARGNFIAITFCGIFLFASVITEEKEEKTLGLLRMTRIGARSLLLGKTLPRLIQFLLLLAIQLPIIFLARTLGGVGWVELWVKYSALFSQLIVVVALSVFSSVVMRTTGGATTLAILLTFAWSPGLLIIEEFYRTELSWSFLHSEVVGALLQLHAELSPMSQIFNQQGDVVQGLTTISLCLCVSGLIYMLTVRTFDYWTSHETTQTEMDWVRELRWRITQRLFQRSAPRTSQSQSAVAVTHAVDANEQPSVEKLLTETREQFSNQRGVTRASRRCWNSAIAWKEFTLLGGGRTGFLIRCGVVILIMSGAGLIGWNASNNSMRQDWDPITRGFRVWSEASTACLFYAFSGDLIYLTVNLFSYELRYQTWESLLILPTSFGRICWQKVCGAAYLLLPWGTAFLLALLLPMITRPLELFESIFYWGASWEDSLAMVGVILQCTTQLATFLLILTWLSIRMNPWVAIALTGALYMGIGIGYIITLFMVFGFMSPGMSYGAKVFFHIAWIGGVSLLGTGTAWSIRSKLLRSTP